MLQRILTAVAVVFALAALTYALSVKHGQTEEPRLAPAVRVACLSLAAVMWLVLASTGLLWVFPLNVVASAAIGYFGTKSAVPAFPLAEIKVHTGLTLAAGVAVALGIAMSEDGFMRVVAAPYSLLNTAAFAACSYAAYRQARRAA